MFAVDFSRPLGYICLFLECFSLAPFRFPIPNGGYYVRKNRGKIILIAATVVLSLYFLYPTYQDHQLAKQLEPLSTDDSVKFIEEHQDEIREAREKRLKLGLDLQGGMRVVLEVNVLKLLEDIAGNKKDDTFTEVMTQVRAEAQNSDEPLLSIFRRRFEDQGIRLSRYYGSIRDSDDDIIDRLEGQTTDAIDRAMEIVRNRVDQYGVSEPTIQKQGRRRIIVELPGVSKEEEVRRLLQGTALLEFKLLKDPEIFTRVLDTVDRHLAAQEKIDTVAAAQSRVDTTQLSLPSEPGAGDAEAQLAKEHPFLYLVRPNQEGGPWAYVAEQDIEKVKWLLVKEEIQSLIPNDAMFVWSAKHAFVGEGKKYFTLYLLKKEPDLTGGVVVDARATIDPDYNAPVVNMEMNAEGSRDWARITGANVGKWIAITLDGVVYTAPVVKTKIVGGRSVIEGMDNVEEAKLIEIVLKAGALPAPVEIIEQRTVGPSLGEDSIRLGVWASLLALGLTVAFMVFYYHSAGSIADFALLFNILFILGVLAAFQGTLTLPGIAGIILTIGLAVDANVLIYERVREEELTGKTLRAAIDAGYSKAFSAIFDSNITTFFTGVILYQFGTGPVQGFALTIMIGIAASLFSAVVITRVVFDTLTERGAKKISFG